MEINKEKLRAWAEVLETTDLPQCKGQLFNPTTGGYCCIGIYRKEIIGDDSVLPYDLEHCPTYNEVSEISGKDAEFFWDMNDFKGMTFKEIAGVIREEFNV